jgi:hypothetical protein
MKNKLFQKEKINDNKIEEGPSTLEENPYLN